MNELIALIPTINSGLNALAEFEEFLEITAPKEEIAPVIPILRDK